MIVVVATFLSPMVLLVLDLSSFRMSVSPDLMLSAKSNDGQYAWGCSQRALSVDSYIELQMYTRNNKNCA